MQINIKLTILLFICVPFGSVLICLAFLEGPRLNMPQWPNGIILGCWNGSGAIGVHLLKCQPATTSSPQICSVQNPLSVVLDPPEMAGNGRKEWFPEFPKLKPCTASQVADAKSKHNVQCLQRGHVQLARVRLVIVLQGLCDSNPKSQNITSAVFGHFWSKSRSNDVTACYKVTMLCNVYENVRCKRCKDMQGKMCDK